MLQEVLIYLIPIISFSVILLLLFKLIVLAILFFQWITVRSNARRALAEITVLRRLKLRYNGQN